MLNINLFIQGLLCFWVGECLENGANSCHMFDEFRIKCLLSEFWEITLEAQSAEVLQVDTSFHQISDGLHGLRVDCGKCRVSCLGVLDVLSFEILKLANEVFLESSQVIWFQ